MSTLVGVGLWARAPAQRAAVPATPAPASPMPAWEAGPSPAAAPVPVRADSGGPAAMAGEEGAPLGPIAPLEHPVDLEALRSAMPDNVYWSMGAPTSDPEVLAFRRTEKARWEAELGKIQSGTASEDEIEAYFQHRERVSKDYIAFAEAVLEAHGSSLPPQEVGLYALSKEMHQTRLDELPTDRSEALERKAEQDARREAWRAKKERHRAPMGPPETR